MCLDRSVGNSNCTPTPRALGGTRSCILRASARRSQQARQTCGRCSPSPPTNPYSVSPRPAASYEVLGGGQRPRAREMHGPFTRTLYTDPLHGPSTRTLYTDPLRGPRTRTLCARRLSVPRIPRGPELTGKAVKVSDARQTGTDCEGQGGWHMDRP